MQKRQRQDPWIRRPDDKLSDWPSGIPYMLGNELCERFSYYGMNAILALHLFGLFSLVQVVEAEARNMATTAVHTFSAGVYFFPMIGALIADKLLGKFNTIFWLSLVYCGGHATMSAADFMVTAASDKITWTYIGLAMIAVGSGGIKPVVSSNIGDQFGRSNQHLLRAMFHMFYFVVNIGSLCSTILMPWIRDAFGAGVAFAIPGIFMFVATLIFWLGRKKYVHKHPQPGGLPAVLDILVGSALLTPVGVFLLWHDGEWLGLKGGFALAGFVLGLCLHYLRQEIARESNLLTVFFFALRTRLHPPGLRRPPVDNEAHLEGEEKAILDNWFLGAAARTYGVRKALDIVALARVATVLVFVTVFWGLFKQHGSTWIFQATQMNRSIQLLGRSYELAADQIPAINPILVLLLIPLMTRIYDRLDQTRFQMTSIRRIASGMVFAALSYFAVAWIQHQIDMRGVGEVYWLWQGLPYVLLTISEVLVAITGLEFAYQQAPVHLKATVMGLWKLTIALGNKLVVYVLNELSFDSQTEFFLFFALLMLLTTALFVLRVRHLDSRYAAE